MSQYVGEIRQNYDILRDCLFEPVLQGTRRHVTNASREKGGNRKRKQRLEDQSSRTVEEDDAEGLADFTNYLAAELFDGFPQNLQQLSFAVIKSDVHMSEAYCDPLPNHTIESLLESVPSSVIDTLEAYSLIEPGSEKNLLVPIFQNYVNTVTMPPPVYNPGEKANACEICDRDWLPLSYHHLIPRSVHAKVVKRGWHEEWQLQSVAWLCRACHSFVHRIAGNEELAREWYTIERLNDRQDVQQWAKWIGRVRWKAR